MSEIELCRGVEAATELLRRAGFREPKFILNLAMPQEVQWRCELTDGEAIVPRGDRGDGWDPMSSAINALGTGCQPKDKADPAKLDVALPF